MVSLAALRIGNVFAEEGGPIDRLDTGVFPVLGCSRWLANAFLRDELVGGKDSPAVFGAADGTGVAVSRPEAGRLAIAGALKRWAYWASLDSPRAAAFGFAEDCSSNGMAAAMGLFRRQARTRARAEAIRHHTLVSWWDGRLPAERIASPFPSVEVVRLHHDAGPGEVVLVFRRTRVGYAYGHAYGQDLATAVREAAGELARSERVLSAYRAQGALVAPANFLERRMLFFATEDGAALFLRRLLAKPHKASPPLRALFDGEIPGPWARWATVWRCCPLMPTAEYLDPDADFFFW